MRIKLTSVMVDDQEKARRFYTEILGFVVKQDFPAGGARWLTVVAPDEPDGTELLLEPMGFPFAETYQKALYAEGVPLTAFAVDDVQKEYARLAALGVVFKAEPVTPDTGPATALFDDTCGNWIMIFEA